MSEINKDMEGTTTEKEAWRKRGGKKGSRRAPRAQCNFATATDNAIIYYNKYPTDYQAAFNFPWFKVMGTEIPYDEVVSGIPDANLQGGKQQIA